MNDVWIALGLTLFAGMATGIGSVIAFTASRTNYRFLSVATGFSAGVMLYVSFVEIFYKGAQALTEAYGEYWGHWINAASFFGGILLIGNRRRAFVYSLLSGLAEPVGAGVADVALRLLVGGESGAIPPQVMGVLFAGVAGIMVYISLDELLPTSRAYGKGHDSLFGLLGGMVLMALSLLLMK